MVKILITTIQVNFGAAWSWHKIHLVLAFLRGRTLFLQLDCFRLDFTSFCICIPQSWPMAGFGAFLTYLFFFTTGRRKNETDVKYFKYF